MNPRFLLLTWFLSGALTLAFAGTYKRIQIDGQFDDWIGVPLAYEDPADSPASADYRRIWIANDEDFLYLRFTLELPENPFTANDNLFIDADFDPATGFAFILGSELLVQGGNGYEQRGGGFNEGPVQQLDWLAAPSGPGIDFEARISRNATFASDGSLVFASPSIALVLEAEDANFTRQETAPDGDILPYDFAEPPPSFSGSATLIPLTASWRILSPAVTPDPDWASLDYDDSQTGWSTGQALLGFTPNPAAYPAPIRTALPTSPNAHYLRSRFDWNANANGVVFVVTNYLSDGAAFYLNGAELRRIRLPQGPLSATTPATGSPTLPAQPTLFALPPNPLVQGENVLAAELHPDPASPEVLVFGLSLHAAAQFPVLIPDPDLPADRAVVAGQSTTFSVPVIGSEPIQYQWFKDGQPLPNATSATLELNTILPDQAGSYAVRVTNPLNAAGATSRAAVLTVVNTPLTLTRPPAPTTVLQGQPAVFEVVVEGSEPITFQWRRNDIPIDGATQATFRIEAASLADAGRYSVVVSNPVTPSLISPSVELTVHADTSPPTIVAASGSASRILVAYSEPVDPTTATQIANYSVDGNLAILAATVDSADPARVVLTTSRQTLGTTYQLLVRQVRDRFGNPVAPNTTTAFLSTVLIDGDFADWEGIPQALSDPADAVNATDYAAAWIFSDPRFIYLRVQLHTPSLLSIFYNNLFIDADHSPETGFPFRGLGSEMLIQGGAGYQEKNGGFNEGAIDNLQWQIQPEGIAAEFELRFSRHATFASDGLPVFTSPSIALFLESENTSFITIDVAPDLEPLVHTLGEAPPPPPGPIIATPSDAGILLSWPGSSRLQSSPDLTAPSWQELPGASSPFLVTPSATRAFFRLVE